MAANTAIEWCDDSASFWWGCRKIAAGCKNCYAEAIATRFYGDVWGPHAPRLMIESAAKTIWSLNRKAEREGKPRVVFINSMSDFFEGEEHDGPIVNRRGEKAYRFENGLKWFPLTASVALEQATLDDLRRIAFEVFDQCQWLRFMLLTKRPENIPKMWPTEDDGAGGRLAAAIFSDDPFKPKAGKLVRRRDNIRLGTSVSSQDDAMVNIPLLRKCRMLSPVIYVSAEPLLGDIDFNRCGTADIIGPDGKRHYTRPLMDKDVGEARRTPGYSVDGIDQIIVGNESDGKKCGRLGMFGDEDAWWMGARSISQQCIDSGTAYFHKQGPRGGMTVHELSEFPAACARREQPKEYVHAEV